MGVPYTISVCVENDRATSTGVSYVATAMPTGQSGVGAVGSFSNGPVIADDFSVSLASDACYTCDSPYGDCETNCSSDFSWLVDLSAFAAMVVDARPANANCDCPSLGAYLLEPFGFCAWRYVETYCTQVYGCPVTLEITLQITGANCRGVLTIGISNIPCFSTVVAQTATYIADDHTLDTTGLGVATFRSETPNQKFGRPAWNDAGVAPGIFDDPTCVKDFTIDPSGVDHYTSIPVPATVTATRVG
jgi:hypothetical protein